MNNRDLDKAITDKKTNEKMYADFQKKVQEIQILNFQSIMNELTKFERDYELSNSGLLLTDDECYSRALQRFYIAKQDGKLDELNQKTLVNA